MPDQLSGSNQNINTTQPTPLKGLKLSGVHSVETITCDGIGDAGPCIVNVDDYDKKLHGPKSAADKLPTRAKKKKKASSKAAE